MDKLKDPFASSISQSANRLFFFLVFHFLFKKKNWRRALPTVKGHSPILSDLPSRGWFLHAQSPYFHTWATFLALIPPSFTSLNPLEKLFRPLQLHSSSHNGKICMRTSGSTLTLLVTAVTTNTRPQRFFSSARTCGLVDVNQPLPWF